MPFSPKAQDPSIAAKHASIAANYREDGFAQVKYK